MITQLKNNNINNGLYVYSGSYLEISNNTVHVNGGYGLYDYSGSFENYNNNIFINDNGYAARVRSIGSINQMDNNAYYNGNGSSPIYGYSSFSQWQTSANLDANSYNPNFIIPYLNIYSLPYQTNYTNNLNQASLCNVNLSLPSIFSMCVRSVTSTR